MKKIQPEAIQLTQATKNISINLTQNEQLYILNFDSKLWITKDKIVHNGEFTCGNLKFSFLVDFKKNTYQIKDFNLNYDIKICYQDDLQEEVSQNEEISEENSQEVPKKNKINPNYSKYGLPIGLGIGGIVSTPFLLGLLGGKKKTKKIKNKNKKVYI